MMMIWIEWACKRFGRIDDDDDYTQYDDDDYDLYIIGAVCLSVGLSQK